ncbi:hypothetical protein F4780DRAFT_775085 [Xylariomycetidae sp. FL0641]|nr:hypothetical protein F4780DRAFT_775085 [Xylariomycetidae sp. FL0641]
MDIPVGVIDAASEYPIYSQCAFYLAGPGAVASNVTADNVQHVVVDPPQSVVSVACAGACIPTYDTCAYANGSLVPGDCCAGFCAADVCRPFSEGEGGGSASASGTGGDADGGDGGDRDALD